MSKLIEIAELNPKRHLPKGTFAPFVEMAYLQTNARDLSEISIKEFNGGGSKFKNGDTLFARITPCLENGKTAKVSGIENDRVAHGSTEFIVISAKEPKYDEDYVYYLARLPEFRKYAEKRMEGTSGRQRVSWQSLAEFEYDFPPKEMRKSVGEILKVFDDKIQLNTQINQTLEQIAQAIFKSWFIDFDPVRAKATTLADGLTPEQADRAAMSVISGKDAAELDRLQNENPDQYHQLQQLAAAFPSEFEEIEGFREVPKGWEILKFKNFVTESKERVANRIGVEEFSVGNNGITPRSEKYKKSLSKTPEKNKIIRNSYIVFGMGSQTLNWGIMQLGEGSVSPAYFVYKLDTNKVDYHYLNLFIHSYEKDYQSLIKPTSRQGQSVDREMFLEKKIYVPDIQLLNIFIEKYHSIMKLKESLSNETNTLIKTRDELLPKLLNGEIFL